MAQIFYQINAGYPNFTAHIEPNVAEDQIHSSIGIYSFDDIPVGDYSITITDNIGCEAFLDNIQITTTTSTTTEIPVTTTTTSTEEPVTTTTTTTQEQITTTTTSTTEEVTTTTTTTTSVPECTSCVEYGYLYPWYSTQGTDNSSISSSDSWEVPLNSDFLTMGTYLGLDFINGDISDSLITVGTTYWTSGGNNSTGFSMVGAGERSGVTGSFSGLQEYAFLWARDLNGSGKQQELYIDTTYVYVTYQVNSSTGPKYGNSVRLVNNNTSLTDGETGTYVGNDGKVYCTICIGTQEWMSENLAETELRDNTAIPTIENNAAWAAIIDDAKCAYDNNYTNVGCGE